MIRGLMCLCMIGLFNFLPSDLMAEGAEQAPLAWQKSMRSLAKSLQDGYPFLYSRSEFRSKDNKKYVLRTLNQFINNTHALPENAGRKFIGAEPLVRAARESFRGFSEARTLYKNQKFDLAQKKIHSLVQNCFACHTAYQVGSGRSGSRSEITGVASPFPRSKIVVLGALREFSAALDWIEGRAGKDLGKFSNYDLAKLHLVISLRSLQDFDRARNYLVKLRKVFSKDKEKLSIFQRWQNDLAKWESEAELAKPAKDSEMNFVRDLRETLMTHMKIRSQTATASENAETFFKLGTLYQSLNLKELSHLPKMYFEACATVSKDKALKNKCTSRL